MTTPPKYISLFGTTMRLKNGEYFRENGQWAIGFYEKNGNYFAKSLYSETKNLEGVQLTPINENEWIEGEYGLKASTVNLVAFNDDGVLCKFTILEDYVSEIKHQMMLGEITSYKDLFKYGKMVIPCGIGSLKKAEQISPSNYDESDFTYLISGEPNFDLDTFETF